MNLLIDVFEAKGANAVIKPRLKIVASLKKKLVHYENDVTREEARTSLFDYVEVFYNNKRLHSSLGYMTPAAYEQAL